MDCAGGRPQGSWGHPPRDLKAMGFESAPFARAPQKHRAEGSPGAGPHTAGRCWGAWPCPPPALAGHPAEGGGLQPRPVRGPRSARDDGEQTSRLLGTTFLRAMFTEPRGAPTHSGSLLAVGPLSTPPCPAQKPDVMTGGCPSCPAPREGHSTNALPNFSHGCGLLWLVLKVNSEAHSPCHTSVPPVVCRGGKERSPGAPRPQAGRWLGSPPPLPQQAWR